MGVDAASDCAWAPASGRRRRGRPRRRRGRRRRSRRWRGSGRCRASQRTFESPRHWPHYAARGRGAAETGKAETGKAGSGKAGDGNAKKGLTAPRSAESQAARRAMLTDHIESNEPVDLEPTQPNHMRLRKDKDGDVRDRTGRPHRTLNDHDRQRGTPAPGRSTQGTCKEHARNMLGTRCWASGHSTNANRDSHQGRETRPRHRPLSLPRGRGNHTPEIRFRKSDL